MDFHPKRTGACRAELSWSAGAGSWVVEGGNDSAIGSMYLGNRCLTKLDVKVPQVSRRVCDSIIFGQHAV